MKIYIFAAAFCFLAAGLAAQKADELTIEMTGNSFAPVSAQSSLWKFNAVQFTRRLRGKTREQVLYAMPVVSNKDRIVRGNGKEYALVEYYSGDDFRKFLFKAEDPQTFITAAATAADVLAVNKKYGVNIGLPRRVFEKAYAGKASAESADALPSGTLLYKLLYADVNTPAANRWFLFEKDELTRTFESEADKNAYLDELKKQAEAAEKTAGQTPQNTQLANDSPAVRKALISGGTTWDKANLPRAVNPKLLPTPSLKKADK